MNILGINAFTHDASAALLTGETPVAYAEEERFNREKHTGAFPFNAIQYCLDEAGILPGDVDHIAFAWDPFCGLIRRYMKTRHHLRNSEKGLKEQSNRWFDILKVPSRLRAEGFDGAFHYVNHYNAHAASSYFPSPFSEAAILVVDGVGEIATASYITAKGNTLTKLKEIDYPHSIGLFYAALTEYLGYRHNSGEGKVMGLASYGDPGSYYDRMKETLSYTGNGDVTLDDEYFNFGAEWLTRKFVKAFGPPRRTASINKRFKDIAASGQKVLEDVVLEMLGWLKKRSGSDNLCFSGGVALNSVLNGRIVRSGIFDNYYFQPVANDAGTSLGAALYLLSTLKEEKMYFSMNTTFHGSSFCDGKIRSVLERNDLKYTEEKNVEKKTAEALSEGKVVGWFQGRMEVGPRALGNRSILADPRRKEMKDVVNKKVKGRESFRPFAPSVLEENSREYFELNRPSPFMMIVAPVKDGGITDIPAVTHVDKTARLQTVNITENPRYHRLISKFKSMTGVPVVLNTSFNRAGEPIVRTPEEAIKVFLESEMDTLVLENFMVKK